MKKVKFNKTKGFTLIELLVVISIIAILSVIGITVFGSAQTGARDARRRADIDAIAKAIETQGKSGLYYTGVLGSYFSNGTVPVDGTNAKYSYKTDTTTTAITTPTTWASTDAAPSGFTAIPTAGVTFPVSTITWMVCARLESGSIYCKPNQQ